MALMSPTPAFWGKPTYTQHPRTQKKNHKVQLISELANNENTLTIKPTETYLNEKILDSEK